MSEQFYRFNEETAPPTPPNILFDGTRLGLEATLLNGLCFAVPAGLHCGLSITLGYFGRLADMPQIASPFSIGRFFWMSLFSTLVLVMILFFSTAIPTMLYTMGLVRFALFWLSKRKGHDRRANAIVGGILGFLFALPCSAFGLILVDLFPPPANAITLLRWPAILTVDGILMLWMTLLPFFAVAGGVRSGIKLGQIAERVQMYWFF